MRSARAEVRLSFGVPDDVPLLLFVGSQYRLKGLEFVIRALAEMKTKAILLVVGGDAAGSFQATRRAVGRSRSRDLCRRAQRPAGNLPGR